MKGFEAYTSIAYVPILRHIFTFAHGLPTPTVGTMAENALFLAYNSRDSNKG